MPEHPIFKPPKSSDIHAAARTPQYPRAHACEVSKNLPRKRTPFLSVNAGKICIDQGIGHVLGNAIDAPVPRCPGADRPQFDRQS